MTESNFVIHQWHKVKSIHVNWPQHSVCSRFPQFLNATLVSPDKSRQCFANELFPFNEVFANHLPVICAGYYQPFVVLSFTAARLIPPR